MYQTRGRIITIKLTNAGANRLGEVEVEVELSALSGMHAVSIDSDKGVIRLAYDATGVDQDEVVTLLASHQLQLRDVWWPRF